MRKNIPNAVNKIQWRNEMRVEDKDRTRFEITIKENGKVVYHNTAYAGVVNFVQSVDDFDVKELSFTGDTQVFGFGHPCIQIFALDQLRIKLRKGGIVEQALRILNKLSDNPELREFMLSVAERNSIKKG
jgi:RimJ/RimL family protein N-acetyltransferase